MSILVLTGSEFGKNKGLDDFLLLLLLTDILHLEVNRVLDHFLVYLFRIIFLAAISLKLPQLAYRSVYLLVDKALKLFHLEHVIAILLVSLAVVDKVQHELG